MLVTLGTEFLCKIGPRASRNTSVYRAVAEPENGHVRAERINGRYRGKIDRIPLADIARTR